jgi:hypothetical protein
MARRPGLYLPHDSAAGRAFQDETPLDSTPFGAFLVGKSPSVEVPHEATTPPVITGNPPHPRAAGRAGRGKPTDRGANRLGSLAPTWTQSAFLRPGLPRSRPAGCFTRAGNDVLAVFG